MDELECVIYKLKYNMLLKRYNNLLELYIRLIDKLTSDISEENI
jgi:hypothetical protein